MTFSFRLQDDWTQFWKWASTWLKFALAAAPVLYLNWQQMQAFVPVKWFAVIMITLWAASQYNALRQKKPDTSPAGPPV